MEEKWAIKNFSHLDGFLYWRKQHLVTRSAQIRTVFDGVKKFQSRTWILSAAYQTKPYWNASQKMERWSSVGRRNLLAARRTGPGDVPTLGGCLSCVDIFWLKGCWMMMLGMHFASHDSVLYNNRVAYCHLPRTNTARPATKKYVWLNALFLNVIESIILKQHELLKKTLLFKKNCFSGAWNVNKFTLLSTQWRLSR